MQACFIKEKNRQPFFLMLLKIGNTTVAQRGRNGAYLFEAVPGPARWKTQVCERISTRYAVHKNRANVRQSFAICVYHEFENWGLMQSFALKHATLVADLDEHAEISYLDATGRRYLWPQAALTQVRAETLGSASLKYVYEFSFGHIVRGWRIAVMDGGILKTIHLHAPEATTPLIEAN